MGKAKRAAGRVCVKVSAREREKATKQNEASTAKFLVHVAIVTHMHPKSYFCLYLRVYERNSGSRF